MVQQLQSFCHVVEKHDKELLGDGRDSESKRDMMRCANDAEATTRDKHEKGRYRLLARYVHIWVVLFHEILALYGASEIWAVGDKNV